MSKDAKGRKVAPLGASTMVDEPVSQWSLQRVVEFVKKKEKDNSAIDQDHRVYSRSCIRLLNAVIDELSVAFGLARSSMCRCLSYHGVNILHDDPILRSVADRYQKVRKLAIANDDPDLIDIINNIVPYTAASVSAAKVSFRVYDGWALASLEEMSKPCGMFPGSLAQVAMIRSIMTCDSPDFTAITNRLSREANRWNRWLRFRALVLGVAVDQWYSL